MLSALITLLCVVKPSLCAVTLFSRLLQRCQRHACFSQPLTHKSRVVFFAKRDTLLHAKTWQSFQLSGTNLRSVWGEHKRGEERLPSNSSQRTSNWSCAGGRWRRTRVHLLHTELNWVSLYACIGKTFSVLPSLFFLSSSLPHSWPFIWTMCVVHCILSVIFRFLTSLFCSASEDHLWQNNADNYIRVSQWEWVNVFVVRGDRVLKRLLTLHYVSEIISLCLLVPVCVAFQES